MPTIEVTEWTLAASLHKVLHTRAHVHADLVIHGDVKPDNVSKFFEGGILKSETSSSATGPKLSQLDVRRRGTVQAGKPAIAL